LATKINLVERDLGKTAVYSPQTTIFTPARIHSSVRNRHARQKVKPEAEENRGSAL
jgi:hypothetical protein